MTFKNSLKLLCTNFDQVWKLLVYHILSFALCFGFLAIFGVQYVEYVNLASSEVELPSVIEQGTLYGSSFAGALTTIVNFALAFFRIMFDSSIGIGIFFCIIIFVLLPLLLNIGKVVTCELAYGYMSACQKQSFTGTLLKTLKVSLPYALIKLLYVIPFNFITLFCVYGLTRLNFTGLEILFPFVFVFAVAVLCAFKEIFNVGWAPAQVVYNCGTFKSFRIGFRAVLRKWESIFSTAFVIFILAIVLSMVTGIYSLIIILPLISPLFHIFEMTAFFQSQGMRYYVDSQTIVSPKRLEENDKIDDIKYLL